MPQTGIEPVREYKSRRILSPVRLPVPPLQRTQAYNPRYIQHFTIHKLYTRGTISYIIRRILHFYCPYYTTNIFLSYFFCWDEQSFAISTPELLQATTSIIVNGVHLNPCGALISMSVVMPEWNEGIMYRIEH